MLRAELVPESWITFFAQSHSSAWERMEKAEQRAKQCQQFAWRLYENVSRASVEPQRSSR
jgi:hypothetical protein